MRGAEYRDESLYYGTPSGLYVSVVNIIARVVTAAGAREQFHRKTYELDF